MPPLAGPRLMLCWTRQPVKTWTEPSSMRTGKWPVSSRLPSRRLPRASSERPMTSAAASNRRCAVWKAEARVATAMWRLPIVTPGGENCGRWRERLAGIVLVGLVALATGFVLAADAGLVATHGPGVKLNLRNVVPGPVTGGRRDSLGGYRETF